MTIVDLINKSLPIRVKVNIPKAYRDNYTINSGFIGSIVSIKPHEFEDCYMVTFVSSLEDKEYNKKFDTEEFYDDTFSDSPPKFYYDIAQFDEKLNGYIEHLEIYEEEIFFDLLEDDNYSKNPIGSVYKWLDIANGDNFNESNLDNNIKLYVNLVMEELYETVASFGENKAKSFKSLVQDKLEKIDKDITEGKFPPQGKNATLDGVCDGIVVTANGLRLLGNFNMNDFNKRYDEVMTENFKKYCRTEESAKRTLLKHYNNEDYFYEKAKDGSDFFVIRRKSDNKIMKGEDYFTHINKK